MSVASNVELTTGIATLENVFRLNEGFSYTQVINQSKNKNRKVEIVIE